MENELEKYVIDFINKTNCSVFLTGKAGTGKTTLLKKIIHGTHKNSVVVAPTGIAALNAGGVTIHSLFQLPFGAFIPDDSEDFAFAVESNFQNKRTLARHTRMNSNKKLLIRNLELLIIDEVSMLRPDLLDAIDFVLKRTRRNQLPFGGVQVLYIGDMLQLPPIVRREEWNVLSAFYKSPYFFDSLVIKDSPFIQIELEHVYRQSDNQFISILNKLRNNKLNDESVQVLNRYHQPGFDIEANEGYIFITTHNEIADKRNQEALSKLEGEEYVFLPEVTGDFPERIFPLESDLRLKVGAQVMFIKNDLSLEKRYYNGKIGKVVNLDEGEIVVALKDENVEITVDKYEWSNIKYTLNEQSKEINEEVLGTYVQYPLKLAWAITVHKSQGLTFEKVVLDLSRVFAAGQAYVALSRLTSLNGLVLLKEFPAAGIAPDKEILQLSNSKPGTKELEFKLENESKAYISNSLISCYDFNELNRLWKSHIYSYNDELGNSPKMKFKAWAQAEVNRIGEILEPADKFRNILKAHLSSDQPDWAYIRERCEKGQEYFANILKDIHFGLLKNIEEVKRLKRMKAFYSELLELEDITTKTLYNLFKSEKWVKALTEKVELNNSFFENYELDDYKQNVSIRAIADYKKTRLVDDDVNYYEKSHKPKKKDKKSTVEITFELWKEFGDIREIATRRQLTESTIYGHLFKLVNNGDVEAIDVLGQELNKEITEIILENPELSNTELIQTVSGKYSYDQLKIARAGMKDFK